MTTSDTKELVAHEGVQIVMAGRQFILPPMTLLTRKKDIATRKALGNGYDELSEQDLVLQVVLETLQRNYPALTLQEIEGKAEYAELIEAYATLKEQEARLVADLGKRVAQAALNQAGP